MASSSSDQEPFHEPLELIDPEIVLLRRTARRYVSPYELMSERLRVAKAMDRIGRSGRHLLVDTRNAPTNTDSTLGPEFTRFRNTVRKGYGRIAVLVRTKVGMLHATRLGEEDSAPERIFDNLEQALAYLHGD